MSYKNQMLFFLNNVLCLLTACNAQPANSASQLTLSDTISLPGVHGRFDHLAYDSNNQILFIAALGNNSVEVVDLKGKKVLQSIKDLNEPQGIAFLPESNLL